MTRVIAISLVCAAACGGGSKPTTVGNTTGGGGGKTDPGKDPWIAVTQGATFTVTNSDGFAITATVAKVEPTADGRKIEIAWSAEGKPLDFAPPSTFTIAKDRIRFDSEDIDFPLATADHQADGREVTIDPAGSVCYTSGPGDGAGECDDVCFAELCVNAKFGVMGGAGTWWPNYVDFSRNDVK
jgi:hypothetical protein